MEREDEKRRRILRSEEEVIKDLLHGGIFLLFC